MKVLALLLVLCAAAQLPAQTCPSQDDHAPMAAASTLTGTIRVHHELRDWIALELPRAACGETVIQLTFAKTPAWKQAEALDGCQATVTGALDFSPTGYYSAKLYISDAKIVPSASCHPKSLRRKETRPAPADLRSYKVSVIMNLAKNLPLRGRAWRTDGKHGSLTPWQSYGKTFLTGGFVLYVGCREGFVPNGATSSTGDQVSVEADLKQGVLAPNESRPSEITVSCIQQ